MDPDLHAGVRTVIRDCLAVRRGEAGLVIADDPTADLAGALRDEAAAAGADAVLCLMDARSTDGEEPPAPVAAALAAADVFLAPTRRSLSHTQARKRASEAGARGATLPGVTAALLARTMAVDRSALAVRCGALAAALTGATIARVTCPAGTDLTLDLAGRQGIADDGDLRRAGAFGNLPCGEGFIAPLGGDGVLYATSLASLGLAEQPVALRVDGGRLTGGEGELADALGDRLRGAGGPQGTNLAELGIGANPSATLTGNVLEDEKILGSVHVAFGASAGIGGTVAVPVHLDCVVLDASITLDGVSVLAAGQLVLNRA